MYIDFLAQKKLIQARPIQTSTVKNDQAFLFKILALDVKKHFLLIELVICYLYSLSTIIVYQNLNKYETITVMKQYRYSLKVLDNLVSAQKSWRKMKINSLSFTLSLPRSSIDDLVFSVFPSNFFSTELQNHFTKKWICDFIFIRFS